MSSYAYELINLQSWELAEGIHEALNENSFKNFRDLGSKVRDLIHGIPSSFQDDNFSISQMEVYLGCARADRLFQRFDAHRAEKGHQYGVIVGICPITSVGYMERAGIALIKSLEGQGMLCVRNAKVLPYKQDSFDEKILTYLTFKVDRRMADEWSPPSKPEREELYKNLLKELGPHTEHQNTNWRNHIREVIDEIHKKTSKETLKWHKNHL